jgi:hypothetical protein
MRVVTESETCRIYKTVLQIIKVPAHNLFGEPKFSNIIQQILDVGLLLHEGV